MRGLSLGKTSTPTPRSLSTSGVSAVAALVRRHDRDRFQTALFAPVAAREPLFALYAFNYEIARIREAVSEPMLGQIRLQWWREVIDVAFAGGIPRDHPVVAAVTAAIREHRLTRASFDRLIDSRERDFDETPPAGVAALEAYAEGSAAVLLSLVLELLGVGDPTAQEAVRRVGIAYGLAGVLRAAPFHTRAGRALLPVAPPVREIAAVAAAHLAAARAMRRRLPRAALPALLPAVVAGGVLRRLERAGFDPAAMPPGDPLQSWRLTYAALSFRF